MSAVLSACGRYRYRLDRQVQAEGKVFAFFGINPSTADATEDDATVRKWKGFTLRNGGSRFIVGNVFAYRATDPKELAGLSVSEACGPDQMFHVISIASEADILVPCWGNSSKVPSSHRPIIQQFLNILLTLGLSSNRPVLHFGTTESGDPRHPLMLSYETPLTPWVRQ